MWICIYVSDKRKEKKKNFNKSEKHKRSARLMFTYICRKSVKRRKEGFHVVWKTENKKQTETIKAWIDKYEYVLGHINDHRKYKLLNLV